MSSPSSVAVLGAGAYGTALARILGFKGIDTTLWCRREERAQEIADLGVNEKRLPGVPLPKEVRPTADIADACTGKDAIVFAVPSLYLTTTVRGVLGIPDIVEGQPKIAAVTKGFVPDREGNPELVLQAMERYLPGSYKGNLVYVSGPSQAEEMGRDKLTGLISASTNPKNALFFRNLFSGPSAMIFPSLDVTGVQVSAAAKNIVAIAFGILDALTEIDPLIGGNTESLLFAAGLNEIQSLGTSLGSTHPETFTSIAGVGDLDTTCRSPYGRNRRFGRQIVLEGILEPYKNLDDLIERIDEIGYLPEGVVATRYAAGIADRRSLKLPIIRRVHRILNREMEPLDLVDSFRPS